MPAGGSPTGIFSAGRGFLLLGLDTGDASGGLGKLIGRIWMHKSANAGINWDCGLAAVLCFVVEVDMGKRLFYWELAGALFTAAMGTLLHFVYDWSGGWGSGGCLLCGE